VTGVRAETGARAKNSAIIKSYWQIRHAIYQQQLKSLLDTMQKMGLALVVIMQAAFPAIIFIGLYCLGQIAAPTTDLHHYSISLSIYLSLLFLMISVQKKGISASAYHYYLSTLPTTAIHQKWVSLGLLTLAGNVFLWAPAGIFLFMLKEGIQRSDGFWQEAAYQLLPLTICTVITIYFAWAAAHKRTLPIFSLLVYPVLLVLFANPADKTMYLGIWLIIALCEPHFQFKLSFKPSIVPKQYFHLLLLFDVANKVMAVSRIVSMLTCVILINTAQNYVAEQTWPYFHLFFLLVISTIAATNQFDLIKFEHRYRYFLASNVNGAGQALKLNQLYCLTKYLLLILPLAWLMPYSLTSAMILITLILSASWAIRKWASYFFLVPLALTCGLISLTQLKLLTW
jgi:hypothetical protein